MTIINNHNKTLKIIHILSGDLWAGAEVMAVNLIRELAKKGECILKAILFNEGTVADSIRQSGVDVLVLNENEHTFAKLVLELRNAIKKFEPHIIHSHRYKENLASYLASRKLKSAPFLVSTQHGLPENKKGIDTIKNKTIKRLNYHILARKFNQTVTVSREMQSTLVSDFGFDTKNTCVVHNGINLPHMVQKKRSNELIAGSCGRFVPVKNYTLLLKCAAIARKDGPQIQFILAGDGPEREDLKMLKRELDLEEAFSMPGHLDDMDKFYKNIDIFINTSWHEGIPMSVLEAMSHGTPVIAPAVGGFNEIIDNGVDGFLIPEHSPELFAARCRELYSDRNKWEQMSQAARTKIENKFSAEQMSENYLQLYQQMLYT